jgi:hypothetical protein
MDLDGLKKELFTKRDSCFACRWIYEDLVKNGRLTGHPKDWCGASLFPEEGKEKHLRLEGLPIPQELVS